MSAKVFLLPANILCITLLSFCALCLDQAGLSKEFAALAWLQVELVELLKPEGLCTSTEWQNRKAFSKWKTFLASQLPSTIESDVSFLVSRISQPQVIAFTWVLCLCLKYFLEQQYTSRTLVASFLACRATTKLTPKDQLLSIACRMQINTASRPLDVAQRQRFICDFQVEIASFVKQALMRAQVAAGDDEARAKHSYQVNYVATEKEKALITGCLQSPEFVTSAATSMMA